MKYEKISECFINFLLHKKKKSKEFLKEKFRKNEKFPHEKLRGENLRWDRTKGEWQLKGKFMVEI